MRTLNVVLDDKDHAALEKAKQRSGKRSWREFLMDLVRRD